jgi:short-subunit dehydrogenase
MKRFEHRYGPWALVAGGSEGIGEAFADELCSRGVNVILVARREDRLEMLAHRLRSTHGAMVRTIKADLSAAAGVAEVLAGVADLDIGLVIFNAAFSSIQPFLDAPLVTLERVVQTNALATVRMVHGIGERLRSRGRGGIILVSSLSAFHGSPMIATYAASKAFGVVLGESLWAELRPHGVDVLVACAGATSTPNFEASRPDRGRLFGPSVMAADSVARAALSALGKRPVAIIGAANRFSHAVLDRLLPRRLCVLIMHRAMNRLYGESGRPGHMFEGADSGPAAPANREVQPEHTPQSKA